MSTIFKRNKERRERERVRNIAVREKNPWKILGFFISEKKNNKKKKNRVRRTQCSEYIWFCIIYITYRVAYTLCSPTHCWRHRHRFHQLLFVLQFSFFFFSSLSWRVWGDSCRLFQSTFDVSHTTCRICEFMQKYECLNSISGRESGNWIKIK